jgi:hypothetical protein
MLRFDPIFDRVIRVFPPGGAPMWNIELYMPGATSTWANDVAVDSDGSFVIAATTSSAIGSLDSRHALMRVTPNGIQTTLVDLKSFWPGHPAIGEDHSVWVLGMEYPRKKDYKILRKYAPDGTLLASFLPRSTFAPGLDPGSWLDGPAVMTAANRVFVVAFSGKVGTERELIELDADGNVLVRTRLDGALHHVTFALTSSGSLYSWFWGAVPPGPPPRLSCFEPANATWIPMDRPPEYYWLIGASDDRLVYSVGFPDHRDDGQYWIVSVAEPVP